jgi:hypothetical protein
MPTERIAYPETGPRAELFPCPFGNIVTIVAIVHPTPEAMKPTLAQFNIVVAANRFNPSVFRESWLIERGLLKAADLQPGFVFAENVVNLSTHEFDLLVLPQNLVLAPKSNEAAPQVIGKIVPVIVQMLPHTPFTGIGINFIWNIDTTPEPIADVTRRLFASRTPSITEPFSDADARFGLYMSKNVQGSRLKLDVKPIRVLDETGGTSQEIIQCSFNFHCDLEPGDNFGIVTNLCAKWGEYFDTSKQITRIFTGETSK